jgi:hypothetical protein
VQRHEHYSNPVVLTVLYCKVIILVELRVTLLSKRELFNIARERVAVKRCTLGAGGEWRYEG